MESPDYQKIFIEAFRTDTENCFVQPAININQTGFISQQVTIEEEFSEGSGIHADIIESLQYLNEAELVDNFR